MNEPLVGIFWGVSVKGSYTLVIDTTALSESESYGEFLTHPKGHYEVWEAWRRQGVASLARRGLPTSIVWQEYEDYPRGRVVYHRPTGLFTIYMDRSLQGTELVAQIVVEFGLTGMRHEIRGDGHYRTSNG